MPLVTRSSRQPRGLEPVKINQRRLVRERGKRPGAFAYHNMFRWLAAIGISCGVASCEVLPLLRFTEYVSAVEDTRTYVARTGNDSRV